jgi:NAD(P)-dependent dehydrogenase (short-subunit alcohol dehydrogenase family)
MNSHTQQPVAVVTGASRGAGAGIARALGGLGYTVYVTGRTLNEGDAPLSGTIGGTAKAVTEAGGRGVAVAVDHTRDAEVEQLFKRIAQDEGRLDILVNNAASIHDELGASAGAC